MALQSSFETASAANMGLLNSFNLMVGKNMAEGISGAQAAPASMNEMSDELFAAVRRGDVDRVRELASSGGDVNARLPDGTTLLMVAAQEKQNEVASVLLASKELLPGLTNDAGLTALVISQTNGNLQLAKLILNKMQANELLMMDGNMGDEMARERGDYALAEIIGQKQRDQAAIAEEADAKVERIQAREAEEESDALAKMATPLKAAPLVEADDEAPKTIVGKVSKFFNHQMSQFSKFFGNKQAADAPALADAAPSAAPQGNAMMNFIKRHMGGPSGPSGPSANA